MLGPVERPRCHRCAHPVHSGKCNTVEVFPPAVAAAAPKHAVPAEPSQHLKGTLVAECSCSGSIR